MTTRKKKTSQSPSRTPGPALYPYQRRWVEDDSRFKIACKARQIGFSFAAAWRVVDKRLDDPGLTVWLSASERQTLEAMEHIRRFCRELRVAALYEESFVEGTEVKQHQVRLPNGSRVVALPANPDTVRGFAGDIVLDEFAFHRDAEAIWRAAFATATRGYQLEIISTPNGTRGKYYELARAAGLVDYQPAAGGVKPLPYNGQSSQHSRGRGGPCARPDEGALAPSSPERAPSRAAAGKREDGRAFSTTAEGLQGNPDRVSLPSSSLELPVSSFQNPQPPGSDSVWSAHWVDLFTARTQGFVVDVESLRAAIGDEDAWQQEYCCRFLSQAAHFIPPELVVAAEHPAATATLLPVVSLAFARDTAPTGLYPTDLWVGASAPKKEELRAAQPSQKAGPGFSPAITAAPAAPPWKGFGETHGGFPQAALNRPCYLGVDIGRRRDLTVLWLLEAEDEFAPPHARRCTTRAVVALDRRPFAEQRAALDALLSLRLPIEPAGHDCSRAENNRAAGASLEGWPENPSWVPRRTSGHAIRRCAIDATGLGLMLAEELQQRWGTRVEPVTFTLAVKEDLAVRVKRVLEERRLRIPYDPVIRAALGAVKRYVTPAGNIRFDADRTERAPHADHFWALALALAAADDGGPSVEFLSTGLPRPSAQSYLF